MLIDRILLLLSIDNKDLDKQKLIEEIISLVATPVALYLGVEEVPAELEYIIIELAIARYNRIGAEGYSEEKNDNVQNRFIETPMIEQYYPALDAWKEAHNEPEPAKKTVRFF